MLATLAVAIGIQFSAVAEDSSSIDAANKRLGRGINLGNFLEVPRDAEWSVAIEPDQLAVIKKAGFDSVRLPVKWSDYAASESPWAIEPTFFERVDRWLDRADKEKLNVVLNVHHYDGLDADPMAHRDRFAAIWKQIAERYANRGSWLYFELDNEPHDKLDEYWNEILRQGLDVVRASNPTRPVIVGPPSWNGIWALSKLDLPNDPNLIVTVHMYNPHEFTHQGASWANAEVQSIKNREWGTPAEHKALIDEIQQAAAWGKKHHRPIFLGEFGAYSMGPLASRVRWTAAVARAAESENMSWAYWEFAAGFGIYDLATAKWRPELLKALIP